MGLLAIMPVACVFFREVKGGAFSGLLLGALLGGVMGWFGASGIIEIVYG